MDYRYVFKSFEDEEPYYDGFDICTRLVRNDIMLQLDIDKDDNIDFDSIIGYGLDTENIKDYLSLFRFLVDNYNEIEEDNKSDSLYSRRELIHELMQLCLSKM